MSTIDIGRSPAGPVRLDIDVLLRTRLLVQANSGGGKSWLLRRLAEQMFGKVQVVIIDPEGEFATLRERYGYVLVGKGGETPADVRSAGLVAIKLLELQAPAVCDIYEMPPAQRHQWVKVFLETLIDAPKKLWHPLVVIVDEAHVYAPERGAGESVASDAMTGLSTRGRKRGFTPIFATQRLGKLRKDVAAECANVMIGQTFIDVDRDRAADTLGVPKREQAAFFDQLRIMPAGHFFALGRALTTTRTLVTVGAVSTTHPEPGAASHAAAAPPTPDKVKHLLPKLADLPKEAEEKAKTEADLRARVRELEREVAAKPAAPAAPTPAERVEVPVLSDWEEEMLRGMDGSLQNACTTLDALAADVRSLKADAAGFRRAIEAAAARRPTPPRSVPARPEAPRAAAVKRAATNGAAPTGDRLPDGERKILTAAAQYPDGPDRAQLSILTGYKRSTRDAYIQRLIGRGFAEVRGDRVVATDDGVVALGDFEPLPVGDALRAYWLDRLPEGEGRVLSDVCAEHPHPRQRDAITETTGYQRSTRDAYLQRLAARRLVIPVGRGEVRAAEELFD